jgi:hypothetical protein
MTPKPNHDEALAMPHPTDDRAVRDAAIEVLWYAFGDQVAGLDPERLSLVTTALIELALQLQTDLQFATVPLAYLLGDDVPRAMPGLVAYVDHRRTLRADDAHRRRTIRGEVPA